MRLLQVEFGEDLRIEWRSFLLRPDPPQSRGPEGLETFRAYTKSWLRPAAEPDSGTFRVWQGEAGPPSHSVPPHLVAKAAAQVSRAAFEKIHQALLGAYFAQNLDITAWDTLRTLWTQAGLPSNGFKATGDPALLQEVLNEHREALESGVTGVPSFQMVGRDAIITGAHPVDLYRRWVRRALAE
jgi:predicted DsbA family dithiol-disulfide isomerase